MNDATLLKIAIVTSISGILLLYIATASQTLVSMPGLLAQDGDTISLKGSISRIRQSGNATFLVLTPSDTATIVLFRKPLFNISEGLQIEVRGRIAEYKQEKELIAEEIRVI